MKKFSQVGVAVLITGIALAHTLMLHIKIIGEANLQFFRISFHNLFKIILTDLAEFILRMWFYVYFPSLQSELFTEVCK